MSTHKIERRKPEISFSTPSPEDASAIWGLIESCEPLDDNSLYCNLLQCDHFAETCVVAKDDSDGAVLGWVSAYLVPNEPSTLFIWQVAVDPRAQGQGIAKRMLLSLLQREACSKVRTIKTTITSDNEASWALFASLARAHARDGQLDREPHFRRDAHFDGQHATEHMVTIDLGDRLRIAA